MDGMKLMRNVMDTALDPRLIDGFWYSKGPFRYPVCRVCAVENYLDADYLELVKRNEFLYPPKCHHCGREL